MEFTRKFGTSVFRTPSPCRCRHHLFAARWGRGEAGPERRRTPHARGDGGPSRRRSVRPMSSGGCGRSPRS